MTVTDMIDAVCEDLRALFKGYTLPNKAGVLQEVKVFAQYMPQPQGITVEDGRKSGTSGYDSEDFEMNFPSVLVKLGEITDNEERKLDLNKAAVRVIFGMHEWGIEFEDEAEEVQFKTECWRDVLAMMEKVRQHWLKDRIISRRFRIEMPVTMSLIEEDTYPLYFGELKAVIVTGRPVRDHNFVYGGCLNG